MGNISKQILIALRAINKASLNPFREIVMKLNLATSSPPTVRGITIRKKRRKTITHRSCFNTKVSGILDRKTKIIAMINPMEASKILESSAIDIMRIVKETIFTLGSQEWNKELRSAYLSISGKCIF